jgi:cell division protein FtsB
VAIVLGIVVVVAAAACAWLAAGRSKLAGRLASATARADALAAERDAAAAERDALAARADDLTRRVTAAETSAEEARADLAAMVAASSEADADGDGLWQLLLAHVARRWGAMVGVPPDGRGVVAGPPAEQLAEALSREIERLREEVGVDVEMVAKDTPDPAASRLGDDPDDRVPALLAALELLGVLVSTAERVTVSLGDELVLTGEGWYDPAGELATASTRATAAGATLGPVLADEEEERAEVVVRPGGGS